MYKLKKIFQSTVAKVVSLLLILIFGASVFFFFDFYKRQYSHMKGYYWVYRGDKEYKNHNLQEAINYYEYAIKLHPKHYRAMYNLANIYVAYEDYYSALLNYKKALAIKPDYEVARINYAIILTETYKTDEAIKEYEKVTETKPKFIKIPFLVDNKKSYNHNRGVAFYNMGLAYRTKSLLAGLNRAERKKYLQKADDSYKKALETLNNYNANYNLALINQLLKNQHQAGYYYCKAMEIEPMEYEAHFNLAVLLMDMKNYTGAAAEFKKAGLILDSKAETFKTGYIYDVLTQVNQKISATDNTEYFKKLREADEKNSLMKYKAGKLILDEFEDEDLIKSFSQCSNREIFVGEGA